MAGNTLGGFLIEVGADLGRFESDMGRAARIADRQAKQMARAIQQQTGEIRSSLERVASTVEAQHGRMLAAARNVAIGVGAAAIVRQFTQAADAAGQFEARMRQATSGAMEYQRTQQRIDRIARDAYKSVSDVSEAFLRSVDPMRQLGYATSTTLDLTEAISLSLVTSAANAQKSASTIDAFGKAMQTGALRGQEFTTVLQNAPTFITALENALGKSRAQLIAMANAGDLTVGKLALVSSELDVLRANANAMPATLEDAATRFGDSWTRTANSINQATGAMAGAVKVIDFLGDHIEVLIGASLTLGIAHGAAMAKRFADTAAAANLEVIALRNLTAQQVVNAQAAEAVALAELNKQRALALTTLRVKGMLAAEKAYAAAQANTAAAVAANTTAMAAQTGIIARMGSGLLALAGGPIGAVILGLGALSFGISAVTDAERARGEAMREGIKTLQEAVKATAALTDANRRLSAVPPLGDLYAQSVANTDLLIAKTKELEAAQSRMQITRTAVFNADELIRTFGVGGLLLMRDATAAVERQTASLGREVKRLSDAQNTLAGIILTRLTPAINTGLSRALDGVIDRMERLRNIANVGDLFVTITRAAAGANAAVADAVKQDALVTDALATMTSRTSQMQSDLDTVGKTATAVAKQFVAAEIERAKATGRYNAEFQKVADTYVRTTELQEKAKKSTQLESEAKRKAAEIAKDLVAANKAIDASLNTYVASLSPANAAWVDFNTAVVEAVTAYNEQIEAARKAGVVDEMAARAKAAMTDSIKVAAAARDAELKSIGEATAAQVKQGDVLGEFIAQLSETASLVSMTARQREVAKAVADVTRSYLQAAAAGSPMIGSLEAVQSAAALAAGSLYDYTDATETVADQLENALSRFGEMNAFDQLTKDIALVGEALAKATDPEQIERMERALGSLRQEAMTYATDALGQGISSLQTMATQGTRAYAALEVAQTALNLATAIGAIANQGMGDPYTAFARIAAMAAIMSQLVKGISGIGSSGFTDTAARRQQAQGTGSVLGDPEAKSESISRAIEITAEATTQLVSINRGMLNALLALRDGLGSAANLLARGAGNVDFSGFDLAVEGLSSSIGGILPGIGGTPVFEALFGGSSKITDQGIVIFGGALTDLLNNIAIGAYQEVQSRSWAFGGRHTREAISDISDEFGAQFQLVISAIVDTVREGALALGLLPKEIEAAIEAFRVAEIRISLKGLTAEEQQAELEAVFSQLFDGLAAAVVPFVEQFQRVGEGLGETLVRIATEVQVAQAAFEQLGLVVSEKLGPERFAQVADGLIQAAGGLEAFMDGLSAFMGAFATESHQFGVAQQALSSALGQVGLAVPSTRDGMWELMQSLDATSAAGQEQIATLLRLAEVADQYYDQLEEAADLLAGMGIPGVGLSAARREILGIEDAGRQAAEAANALARAQGRAGASAVELARIQQWTAAQIEAAIRRLQQATMDMLAELRGGVPGSLDAINDRIAALEGAMGGVAGAIDSVSDAGQRLFEQWQQGIQSVQDYLDSMLLGDLSALNPAEQLAEARRQLEEMAAAAAGGDAGALANLPGLSDVYLRMLREFGASGADYNDGFAWVRELLGGLVGMPNPGAAIGGAGSGGGTTTYVAPSPELIELYNARDALLAEQQAQHQAELWAQVVQNIADLAYLMRQPVMDVMALYDTSLRELAEGLGIDLRNLTAESVLAIGNMATTLGLALTDITTGLGLNLTDLATGLTELTGRLGIDLSALTVESTRALADLAGALGGDLSDLATALGLDLGALANAQGLLNQALAAEINGLPADQRDLLAPLLEAIAAATSEADANAAIAALEAAVLGLPPNLQNLLAPYLAGVGIAPELTDLDYLGDIHEVSLQQRDLLTRIANNLQASNAALDIPSYAVGTGYVPSTGPALLHEGEVVMPRAVSDWARANGLGAAIQPRGGRDRDAREIREELAALRRAIVESDRNNVTAIERQRAADRDNTNTIAAAVGDNRRGYYRAGT